MRWIICGVLAASADPLTRASALLAAGACEQQLGNPLGAARTFAEAAQLLRSTPGLSRFGLRAEISRIEALLAAGDLRHAHASLHALVVILLADHPGRPGPAGCEELRRLARRLALRPDDEILLELDRLERRAARRVELENVFREQLSRSSDISLTEPDDLLISYVLDSEPLVVVQRVLDGTSSAALAVPLRTLFERYWRPVEPDAPWRFAARSEMSRSRILVDLRPEFANSVLEPTPPVLAGLRATQQRWLGLLALVGAGHGGGLDAGHLDAVPSAGPSAGAGSFAASLCCRRQPRTQDSAGADQTVGRDAGWPARTRPGPRAGIPRDNYP